MPDTEEARRLRNMGALSAESNPIGPPVYQSERPDELTEKMDANERYRALEAEVKEQRELKEEAEATAEAYLARIKQVEEALRDIADPPLTVRLSDASPFPWAQQRALAALSPSDGGRG